MGQRIVHRHRIIYVTTKDRNAALTIGRFLVQQRLVASVNVVSAMTAIYWWEGRLREGEEALMIAKTREALVDRVVQAIQEQHDFETPCIVVVPIVGGLSAYLDWVTEQTSDPRQSVHSSPDASDVIFEA